MSHNLSDLTRSSSTLPNYEVLRQSGWQVASATGSYCVVFRGSDEVVLHWRNGHWQQVGGRSGSYQGV